MIVAFHVASRFFCAALFILLAACGGGGGNTPPAPASNVFVADSGLGGIWSIADRVPPIGTLTGVRAIYGTNTFISACQTGMCVRSLALDAVNDHLYVSQGTLYAFHNAGTATGNISPNRLLNTLDTQGVFRNANFLFLDTPNNTLYATDESNGVNVFASISTAGGPNPSPTMDVKAVRSITTNLPGSLVSAYGLALDAGRDMLYLAVQDASGNVASIHVFDAQSGLNGGPYPPSRTLNLGPRGQTGFSIYLDSKNDRLYVADANWTVEVYETASAASGVVTPAKSLSFPFQSDSPRVFVDVARDRLYAVGGSKLFTLDNISTANDLGGARQVTVIPAGVQFPRSTAIVVRP